MQIIIPMSGFGERFRRSGYAVPKPLIEIDGKPIISYVIDMFPEEKNFIFICNQQHLDNGDYRMEEILRNYCPTGKIVGIPPHKLGPINAIRQAEHLLDLSKPVVVNYCDFTCYWDWGQFKLFVEETGCVGAIPAYKGFHPHSLGKTNYAYMRETGGWVEDIQEKQPYTNNRLEEFASSGTYYFSSAQVMSKSFQSVIENDLNVGGEYYVSLAYKPLLAQKLPVAVYPLQHFMQWGTPEDVEEYVAWSKVFRELMLGATANSAPIGGVVIPMAGLGQRFANEGYSLAKPLIPVSGLPMVVQATRDLPSAEEYVFVLRTDMQFYDVVIDELKRFNSNTIIKSVSSVTDGQACSAWIGVNALEKTTGPITIGACDNGVIYNELDFNKLINNPSVDIIVWCVRGYTNAIRNPGMYGWIEAEADGRINSISVKKPLQNPASDPVVLGAFTFRCVNDFNKALEHLIARDGRVNGEFYIDSLINDAIEIGMRCYLFEVDSYLGWGTPNDLRTFEYWQSCFHKWKNHPYRLELDARVPHESVQALEDRYRTIIPELPEMLVWSNGK